MKLLAILLAICLARCHALGLSDDEKLKHKEYKQACIAESGVDADAVEAAKWTPPVTREPKLDCYFSCYLKKTGIQRADGTIDAEAGTEMGKKWIKSEEAAELVNKCKDLIGKDHCDTAGNYKACIVENKKKT